jgi:hypothetical protein
VSARTEMMPRGTLRLGALVLPICVGLGACGAGVSDRIVARIDQTAITNIALDHWISVMNAGRAKSDPARQQDRALQYLISSRWLIDESASRGLTLSEQEVRQRVAARQASFPGGEAEFHKFLPGTHRNGADVEFEAKVELASSKLRQLIAGTAGDVTRTQVATYYERHRQLFVIPETRVTKHALRKKRWQAERLKREVESGKRDLTSTAQRTVGEATYTLSNPPGKRDELEVAVFAAKPYAVSNILALNGDYYLFQVIKVIPPVPQPLAQVQGAIKKQLAEAAQRRALAAFVKAWRTKWTGRTDCSAGYVVQKCRQYSGPLAPEDPLGLS